MAAALHVSGVAFAARGAALRPSAASPRRAALSRGLAAPAGVARVGVRARSGLGRGTEAGLLRSRRVAPLQPTRPRLAPLAASAAAAAAQPEPPVPGSAANAGSNNLFSEVAAAARAQFKAVDGLWGQLIPMTLLFFCMAFVNTLLDAVKDTLVVTAGGVEQLPFLLVYVVFPASILFLLVFTAVSKRFSRRRTFNIVVGTFAAFFILFGAVLYPLRDMLHPYAAADALAAALPAGLAGAVSCIRTWTYTLFYLAAELWGDVVLSLLFWGLANDITRVHEAPILYPLFGIGANVAQTAAGLFLKALGALGAALGGGDADVAWGVQLRALCVLTVTTCGGIMALHSWILARAQAGGTARGAAGAERDEAPSSANGAGKGRAKASAPSVPLKDSLAAVLGSPQVRCLAACAVAQGVSQCLMEFAWKGHLRALHPTPADYAAYMGDVATATGALTALMMLASPALFARLGWRGAAGLLPRILLVGGAAFFGGSIMLAHSPPAAAAKLLPMVVFAGALLFVFSRAAKYALFKPAEEMVYIHLSEEARTRGKAAVDVVANQAGKSGGSLFNQGLLLLSSGSLPAVMPIMAVAFLACVGRWMGAVTQLANVHLNESAAPAAAAEAKEGGEAAEAEAAAQGAAHQPA